MADSRGSIVPLLICLAIGGALFGLMAAVSYWAYAIRCTMHSCGAPIRLLEMAVLAAVVAFAAFTTLRIRWAGGRGARRLSFLLLAGLPALPWFWRVRGNIARPFPEDVNLVFAYAHQGLDFPQSPGAHWRYDHEGLLATVTPLPQATDEFKAFGVVLPGDEDEAVRGGHAIALNKDRAAAQRAFVQMRSRLELSTEEVEAAPAIGDSVYAAWLNDGYHLVHSRCQALAHLWLDLAPDDEVIRWAQGIDDWLESVVCRARS